METANNKRKALGKGLEQLFSNESLYTNPLDELNQIQENAKKEDIVELDIKDLYVTDSDYIPEEFYGVALPSTVLYKRAAGFFSSSALSVLGRGLKRFYYN